MFIFGLLELSKKYSIPSYLFIYTEENELLFVKKYNHLCVPWSDIGSNYQIENEEEERLKANGKYVRWSMIGKINEIQITPNTA